jgi:CBS domain-containing protein
MYVSNATMYRPRCAIVLCLVMASTLHGSASAFSSKQRVFVGTPTSTHPQRTVIDCMSVAKVKLTPNQSADEAIVALLSNKVQAAPVLDENKLVGIVTSYDFLQREAFEGAVVPVDPTQGSSNVESYAAAARKICGRKVSDVMTASPETVKRDARMRDVAAKMARDRLHTIPVVDDDGGLLGMITSDDVMRDVLNVVKELPEGRNDVLPDMRP